MRNILAIGAGLLAWSVSFSLAQQYVISTVAGRGSAGLSGDGGQATAAQLNYPTGVAVDPAGNLYVADQRNNRIRKVSPGGVITTIAGAGPAGVLADPDIGDGALAVNAQLNNPSDVAVDAAGNVYISSSRVRKIGFNGIIGTIAAGWAAADAQFRPGGLAADFAGNLYIADPWNNRVLKIAPGGGLTIAAGTGASGYAGDGGPAAGAKLSRPGSVAVDNAGNLYIADNDNNCVRKVAPDGIITTVAGTGAWGFSGDGGPAAGAMLRSPNGMAVDPAGNLFIADQGNHRVRMVSPGGLISTVAGNGAPGYSGDGGPAALAALSSPWRLAADARGNIYVADLGNHAIRMLRPAGFALGSAPSIKAISNAASRLAGPVAPGEIVVLSGSGLGPQSAAARINPWAVDITPQGPTSIFFNGTAASILYASDTEAAAIVPPAIGGPDVQVLAQYGGRVSAAATVSLTSTAPGVFTADLSGKGQAAARNADGSANDASHPAAAGEAVVLALTGAGAAWIPGAGGQAPPVSANIGGLAAPVLSAGAIPGAPGVIGIRAQIPGGVRPGEAPVVVQIGTEASQPGVTIAVSAGAAAVAPPQYFLSTIAGNGDPGYTGDGGPAAAARLNYPLGPAVDAAGNFYFADYKNNRVRRVSASGLISTVAGNGFQGYAGDGDAAVNAQLSAPAAAAVDPAGGLFIADSGNSRIRKIWANGRITTIAGNGTYGYSGDGGPAAAAQLSYPGGIAVDRSGNLYIADYDNHRIRMVSPAGAITTIAGNGAPGYSGDGGPAANAQLHYPNGVAVDAANNIYIADSFNSCIRKVSAGIISTVRFAPSLAGLDLTNSQLNVSGGVAVDQDGNLYAAEAGKNRIVRITRTGDVSVIAGGGGAGYSGDGGPAESGRLFLPAGLTVDAAGNIYVADAGNNAIRLLRPSGSVTAPVIRGLTSGTGSAAAAVAPGEIITLYGAGLGPAQPVLFQPNAAGVLDAQLAYTSVLFNGRAAPVVYASASQVTAIVPYGIGGSSAQVAAQYQGRMSAPWTVAMAPSAPSLFTWDPSGKGQAAALNQDGSINAASHPAEPGSVVMLFATGEGQTSPPGVDGKLASSTPPAPLLPVAVTIGGQPAPVVYAGGAPGEVAGVMQINARIPLGIAGNSAPVVVQVGAASSQPGVTIAVAGN
jgi:uncharacterized protein (TIGR03437 family)